MPQTKYSEKIEKLKAVLSDTTKQLSRASRFEQRASKLNGVGFVQTLVLGCLEQASVSLTGLVQVSADLNIEISASGLNQRIDWEAVELLREVLAAMVQQVGGEAGTMEAMLQPFSRRKQRKTAIQAFLQLLDWNIFITNFQRLSFVFP